MPEYLAPGVYVEEVPSGARPIEGVGTSTAGFVGMTERGPESAQFISSWLAFQRWYGEYVPDDSYLAYAVQGFFANGGQRCFVSRVASDMAIASGADIDAALHVSAIGRGTWGDNITFRVETAKLAETAPAGSPLATWFRVIVEYNAGGELIQEDYDNLTERPGASNNVITTINAASKFVRVWWLDGVAPAALQPVQAVPLAGGDDGVAVVADDYTGDPDPIPLGPGNPAPDEQLGRGRGLAALEMIDEVALLSVPDEVRNGFGNVTTTVIDQCTRLKDRFAVVSVTQGQSSVVALRPPEDTTYAAFYYPWIRVFDPSLNDTRLIPPGGHVTGIFARTDIERGVHKAPANEVARGATDLEFPVTKAMQDMLNPRGVNCIRDFRGDGRGIRLWGARTMSSDPEWRYVNVRRLFLFVEESIEEGTQWVVFEPNDDSTWAKVRRNITNFLISVWRSGALMGTTQDEAFYVICDRTTMTEDDILNGRLICVIAIAPVRPAEFVIFRISQKTADAPA